MSFHDFERSFFIARQLVAPASQKVRHEAQKNSSAAASLTNSRRNEVGIYAPPLAEG